MHPVPVQRSTTVSEEGKGRKRACVVMRWARYVV